jgi:hypothetical protein
VLFGLDPTMSGMPAGRVPSGARQGKNSAGKDEYAGPCPPEGDEPHHYEFVLYALSKPIDLADGASAEDVRAAIEASAIARGTLTGRFGR